VCVCVCVCVWEGARGSCDSTYDVFLRNDVLRVRNAYIHMHSSSVLKQTHNAQYNSCKPPPSLPPTPISRRQSPSLFHWRYDTACCVSIGGEIGAGGDIGWYRCWYCYRYRVAVSKKPPKRLRTSYSSPYSKEWVSY